MRAGLLVIVFSILFCSGASAQVTNEADFKKKFGLVDGYLYDGDYFKALPLAKELYAYDTTNANVAYMLGTSYLGADPDRKKAIMYLEQAISTSAPTQLYKEGDYKERTAPGIAYYNLAKAYHFAYRFDDAVSNFYNYRSYVDLEDVKTYSEVKRQIEYAENAKLLIEQPVNIKVQSLPTINSKYEDYSPVISADGNTLIFTSRRDGSTGGKLFADGKFYEDIYISKKERGKWITPKSIGVNINTEGHEATIGLSPDGQQLFIYKDDNGDGNIYMSRLNGSEWSKPEKLGGDINTPAWETHATISADGQNLFFVSNRKGGSGGRDIYKVSMLPSGQWGMAENLGPTINTAFEEEAPFFAADGKTLIFSSQGHNSMGGFDIFTSENIDGVWSTPQNIGYPINTPEDDVFFVTTPDGRFAYYSSRMEGGMGEKDIYLIELQAKKQESLAVMKGAVILQNSPEISANIIVTDIKTKKLYGIYKPNKTTGSYIFILQPGAEYNVSYESDGYETRTDHIVVPANSGYSEITKAIVLDPVVFAKKTSAAVPADTAKAVVAVSPENDKLANEVKDLEAQLRAQEAKAKEEATLAEAKKKEEATRLAEEKKKADEAARLKAEEVAKASAVKKAEETRLAEEKKKADEAARLKAEEAAKAAAVKKAEETRLAEEAKLAATKKTEESARLAEEKKKADEAAKLKAEEEAKLAAAKKTEEATRIAEEKKKAEEAAKLKAEEEAKLAVAKKAEEAARLAEEKKKAEEAAKLKAEEEAKIAAAKKAEEAARLAAEKKKAEEEAKLAAAKKAEEAARLAEEKKKAEEAAKLKAEEDAKLAAAKKAEEESARAKAAEKKKTFEDSLLKRKNEIIARLEELKKMQAEKLAEEKEAKSQSQLKAEEEKRKEDERVAAEAKLAEDKRAAEEAANNAKLEAIRKAQEKIDADRRNAEEAAAKAKASEEARKQEEALANTKSIDELKKMNQALIAENEQLKKQIAESNKKIDQLTEQVNQQNKNYADLLAKFEEMQKQQKYQSTLNKTDFASFQEGKTVVLKNIFFDYNLSIIKNESAEELLKLYTYMRDNKDVKVEVSGHTDSHGNDNYNIQLSRERADAVVRYLERKGIDGSRFKSVGMGESQPIAINENPDGSDNAEGRKLNRRIEIRILNSSGKAVEVEDIKVPKALKPKL